MKIWNALRRLFAHDYYLDVDGYPKDLEYTHITSWPVLPKGVKAGRITFRKFKN